VPGFRATALLNRSSILAQRQSGDKRDNRTEAISAIERALEFFTADRYPEQHAKLLTNLSNLRSDNIDGDAPVKPEQAVQAARSAIDLVDKDAAPREWASAALALANALYVNSRGNDADSLEEALKLNVEASRIFTPDEDLEAWFRCSLSLLNVWADRLCGNPAENQEYAIALLEAVKEKVSWKESPAVWRSTRLNLGLSYLHRAQGHTTDNVEYALALAEEALAFTDVNTAKEESFSLFELLGDAYVRRVRGSPLENIRAAATAYEDAGATNAHSKTSAAGRRLGSKARRTMIQRGAIERAHAERRGTAAPGHYQGWREVSTSQYLMDIERIGDNLSPATEPSLWRQWMEEKSDIWLSMDPTDDGSDGTFASLLVRLHEGAIKARQLLSAVLENVNFEREPEIAAYYLEKLGRACGVLQLCGEWRKYRLLDPATDAIPEVAIAAEETDYLSQGIACFSQAIELKEYVGSDVVDLARLRALVGEKLCEAGRWEEAIQVFDLAAAQLDVLVTTIETNSVDLASALHTLGSVSQFGPYASIMLGDWKGALELKEIGHARLAAKAITLDALPLPEDIRESIIRLDREWTDLEHKLASNRTFSRLKPLRRIGEIRAELAGLLADGNTSLSGNPDSIETTLEEALSEGCCLVVPVVGRMGGKVIVCRKVGERVDTRVREAGDAYELDRILNARNHGSLDSTARHPGADIRKLRGSLWPNHVDQLCAGISKALVEPVIDALEELGSEGVDELLFAGIGEIGVLPLQVSDTGEAGSPLLDFFAVRVTPSLTISSTLSKRADWESARCGQATIVCQSDNQELRHLITEANWYRVGSPIA
jgi:tetratricopeptide (TPR) repeat protein